MNKVNRVVGSWLPLAGVVAASLLCGGCPGSVNTPPNGDQGAVSFAAEIQPIFTTNCAGCHSPGGAADLAGITVDLREGQTLATTLNQVSVQQNDLIIIVPGNANSSFLFEKISSDAPTVGERMPRFAPVLSDAQISLIRTWIDQGALDN